MKKYLMGLIALALAVGFTGFKVYDAKTSGMKFFVLSNPSDETNATNKVDPSKWELAGGTGQSLSCNQNAAHLCQIEAEEDGDSELPVIEEDSPLYEALHDNLVPARSVSNPRIDTYN